MCFKGEKGVVWTAFWGVKKTIKSCLIALRYGTRHKFY